MCMTVFACFTYLQAIQEKEEFGRILRVQKEANDVSLGLG